jgi:hypothetical protein
MRFFRSRNIERVFLLSITAVLVFLFLRLYDVLKKDFEEVPGRLADGSMVNLNGSQLDQRIKSLLEKEFYFEDPLDIALAYKTVSQGLATETEMDNIGELNKKRFFLTTEQAFNEGGESYRKRAALARTLIGFSGNDSLRFKQELQKPPALSSVVDARMGKMQVDGKVKEAQNVLVRLQMVIPDSVRNIELTDGRVVEEKTDALRKIFVVDSAGYRELQSLVLYARTDAQGKYVFKGLLEGKTYEVLPLKPHFQFGPSKGVESLDKNVSFDFKAAPHTIRLFSTRDFNNLKKEGSLIVRTPEEVSRWFGIIMIGFFAGFFLLHIFMSFFFPKADQLILPVIMLLTGISFLTLLSLQDPLRDRFLAQSTFGYFIAGIFLIGFL